MIEVWVLILALFFTVLHAVTILLGMRILTVMEIISRSIPLGSPKVVERRPPPPNGGNHRPTQEI
jgi:hypothetical protein